MSGERIYFDCETNGLLDLGDKLVMHCITAINMDTGEELYYGPPVDASHPLATPLLARPTGTVVDGARRLASAELLVAHNGVTFDYLALEQCFPEDFKRPKKAWDSMVAAKMVWPYDVLADRDFALYRKGVMPAKLCKSQSLKAWGIRLGDLKDDYDGDRDKYPDDAEERYARRWDEPNPYMLSYAMQDVRPGLKLWKLIEERVGWNPQKAADVVWPERVFEVEHEVARIIDEQERFGVRFDREAGIAMATELRNEKRRLEKELIKVFGSWWAHTADGVSARTARRAMAEHPNVVTPRVSEKTGKELKPLVGPPLEESTEGSRFTYVEYVDFKPSSRDHLGQRLQAVFGWKPKKFGANGKPTVDESVLQEIPEAVMPASVRKIILDSFVVDKTLGMLDRGTNAWLKLSEEDGRIHGRIDTLGAVTGRPTHKRPNMSQVPAVRKAKVKQEDGSVKEVPIPGLDGRYGIECRRLFTADEGWEQTGVDASSLELIMLGHYLYALDGGTFSARVSDPSRDPHTEHAELTGLTRGDTKTATYLYVYGGSAYKLSLDITITEDEIPEYLAYRGLPMLLKSLEKRFDADFVAKLDDAQKAKIAKARTIILKFEGGIDGIKALKEGVTSAAERGWLKGFDGRKLMVRAKHAALNTLLQGGGIQAVKLWMVLLHRALRAEGLVHGRDYKQILWSHDEFQFTHRPGLGPLIRRLANEKIKEAGRILGLKGEFRSDGSTGKTWFDTH